MAASTVPAAPGRGKLVDLVPFLLLASAAPACSGTLDDNGVAGSTGQDPADVCFALTDQCNGVYLACENANAGGADETSGDDAADDGNYWYDKTPQSDCTQLGGEPVEYVEGVFYCKWTREQKTIPDGAVLICAGQGKPTEFDPLDHQLWSTTATRRSTMT